MKRVFIEWSGPCAQADGPWMDIEEATKIKPLEARSIGFLIKETDEYLVLAASLHATNARAAGVMCIPKKNILNREEMGYVAQS